jgi:hypothetical protein
VIPDHGTYAGIEILHWEDLKTGIHLITSCAAAKPYSDVSSVVSEESKKHGFAQSPSGTLRRRLREFIKRLRLLRLSLAGSL